MIMISLIEVLVWIYAEGTFGDSGPYIPTIRLLRCLHLFFSTHMIRTYMQPLICFEA